MSEAQERDGDRPHRGGDRSGGRHAAGRLAHAIGDLAQHPPAARGAGRLSLRFQRLQRRSSLRRGRARDARTSCCPMRSTPTTCASPTAAASSSATISRATASMRSTACTRRAADAPRMMSVGLHLRIIGRPGRIAGSNASSITPHRNRASGSRAAMRSLMLGEPELAFLGGYRPERRRRYRSWPPPAEFETRFPGFANPVRLSALTSSSPWTSSII